MWLPTSPPARPADKPVELNEKVGPLDVRAAGARRARRLVSRYETALANRRFRAAVDASGVDHDLVRKVATWEQKDASTTTGETC